MQSLDLTRSRQISPVLLTRKRYSYNRVSPARACEKHRALNKSESPVQSEKRDDPGNLHHKSLDSSNNKTRQSQSKKINIEIHIAKPLLQSATASDQAANVKQSNPL